MLLTIDRRDAAAAVSWATELRAAGRIENYGLTPASLEDAYLAATATPSDDAGSDDHAREDQRV